MSINLYARCNSAGEPVKSTSVCAQHFYMSPVTPQTVTSPCLPPPDVQLPPCRFCEKGIQ